MEPLHLISSQMRSLDLQKKLRESLAGKHDHLAKRYQNSLPNFIVIGAGTAGSVVATVPVLVIFLWFEKYLVSGLTAGSVKG